MKVIRAESMGMCFGVRDALRIADAVERPEQTTIYGELVHNEIVLHQLSARGFRHTDERNRSDVPATPAVLITAHGVSDRVRAELIAAGKQMIDTTCPLVRRVHDAAQQLQNEDYHVVVLGKPGHVEVQGIVEDLHSFDVVGSVDQVRTYLYPRLGIVCQSTVPPQLAQELCLHIQLHNQLAEIRFIDTICEPTRRRQYAMQSLLGQVQAVVVVGGSNSNNTRQLVALCEQAGVPALHVQSVADLDRAWLARFEVVGLTAGTSTLEATITEVAEALENFTPSRHCAGKSA